MQRKSKSDDGLLPTCSSKCIPSLRVSALLLPKRKENASAACSGSSQHNQIGKTKFPSVEAKAPGPGRGITPSSLLEEFICIFHHKAGWLCSFRLLGLVRQGICEKSLQPTAWVARDGTQQNSGDSFKKP